MNCFLFKKWETSLEKPIGESKKKKKEKKYKRKENEKKEKPLNPINSSSKRNIAQ